MNADKLSIGAYLRSSAVKNRTADKLHDVAARRRKAEKIAAILHDFWGAESGFGALRCLDVGCATGVITHRLAAEFELTVGLDPDVAALGRASRMEGEAIFAVADAAGLPFEDGAFDVVICAQVYEHVADPVRLAAEIWRVLKPNGLCFFSGPNRLEIIEGHHHLPFLSWLPSPLADLYLKLARDQEAYHERPLTCWSLRRLWERFEIHDYTVEMLRQPERFHCGEELRGGQWMRRIPRLVWRALFFLLPNYNWVLRKSTTSGQKSGEEPG